MLLSPRESRDLFRRACESRDIPTLSTVLGQARRVLGDPSASARHLAESLRRDQVLSAKVLRLVNSSAYSLSVPVTNVRKALQFIGDDTLRTLLLGTTSLEAREPRLDRFDPMGFWRHSFATACLAENFARKAELADPETHFTCGLLHDIGKLALYRANPAVVDEVVRVAFHEHLSFLAAEQKLGLPGHTLVGEKVTEAWGLPVLFRQVIRGHHRDPFISRTLEAPVRACLLTTVLANEVANRSEIGFSGNPKRGGELRPLLEALRLGETDVSAAIEESQDLVERVAIEML